MNRRQAIAIGATAAIGIPAGLFFWNKSNLKETADFSDNQKEILSHAVDAIIPETTIPGAKSLGVDLFVATMINDCYDKETQKEFKAGIKTLEEKSQSQYSKSFKNLSNSEVIEILKSYNTEDKFIGLLRGLTIKGYSSSEYVMTNIQHFEFIPGRYFGCVNLKLENA